MYRCDGKKLGQHERWNPYKMSTREVQSVNSLEGGVELVTLENLAIYIYRGSVHFSRRPLI